MPSDPHSRQQIELSLIINELIALINRHLEKQSESAVALSKLSEALQTLSRNDITREQWEEVHRMIAAMNSGVENVPRQLSDAHDDLMEHIDKRITSITDSIGHLETEYTSQYEFMRQIMSKVEIALALMQSAREDGKAERDLEEAARKRRYDFWQKIILAAIAALAASYTIIEKLIK